MPTLREVLGTSPKRIDVIADSCRLLDAEVADKSGLGGMAIKGAYGVVKGIKPGFIREVVDALLDDFLAALEPLHQQALAASRKSGQYLAEHGSEMAESLLAITDARAERAQRPVIRKTYDKLRPSAKKHVEAAAPRLGQMLDRHLG